MRFIKIFLGILLLLALIVAGLVFYAQKLDWNSLKPRVEEEVSKVAGRKFEITGDLHFTLFPEPRVRANGLRLANADWGSEPLMLEATAVSFTLSPWSIVLGDPRARAITMRGVKVLLEEHQDGRDNWHFDQATDGGADSASIFPALRALSAEGVTIIYKNPGAEPVSVDIEMAELASKALGRGLRVDVRGEVNDRKVSVAGDMAPLSQFLGGGSLAGKIDIESADVQLALDGDFGRPPGLTGVDVAVRGKGDTIPAIGRLDQVPEDMRGPWTADFRLSGQKDGYQLNDADLQLGDYRFKGRLAHDESRGYSGTIDVAAPTYTLQLDGDFGALDNLQAVDATVKGSGTEMPSVGALASLPNHLRKDWDANLHIKGIQDRLELTDMKLKVGRSDIAGAITIDRSGPRPRVEGKLSSEFVDIAFLRNADESPADPGKPSHPRGDRVLSQERIPLDWVSAMDASLEISAARLQASLFSYTDTVAKLTIDQGKLRITSERGSIYGAESSGELELDASIQPPRAVMNVVARGADIGKVMGDWSEPPFMTGQGDFELQISMTGDSQAALMGSMAGQLRVVVGEGTAQVGVLERMVKTVGIKTLGALLGDEKIDVVPMNCFAANLSADAGILTSDLLVLDTDRATIVGSGSVDLGKEEWNLVFRPKPKSVTLTTAVPIRIGGTFRDPAVSAEKVGTLRKLAGIASLFVFPPAAVAGLVDFGSGDNQCVQLAAKGGKQ
jgi:uncharacterized protein involved in outer membrane biogenesis